MNCEESTIFHLLSSLSYLSASQLPSSLGVLGSVLKEQSTDVYYVNEKCLRM